MLFKCLKDKAPDYVCSKFSFPNSIHDHSTRGNSSNSLIVPHYRSNSGMRTFHIRASNLWNNRVNVDTRSNFKSMSLGQFKSSALFTSVDGH